MTKEDKELLLKDLCSRLPYGVKAYSENVDLNGTVSGLSPYSVFLLELHDWWDIEFVRPYLRPMSSMTEEEFESLKEYSGLKYDQLDLAPYQNGTYKCLDFYLNEVPSDVVILVFDWLNTHHFDYRGLIEKGLALEAPKDMYNLKDE